MPLKLSTTIGKIQNIHNAKNIEIVNEFLNYMITNGSSEHHQNNNLKVGIAYGNSGYSTIVIVLLNIYADVRHLPLL